MVAGCCGEPGGNLSCGDNLVVERCDESWELGNTMLKYDEIAFIHHIGTLGEVPGSGNDFF